MRACRRRGPHAKMYCIHIIVFCLCVVADGGNCRVVEVDETTGVVSLELEVPVCIPMQFHLSVNCWFHLVNYPCAWMAMRVYTSASARVNIFSVSWCTFTRMYTRMHVCTHRIHGCMYTHAVSWSTHAKLHTHTHENTLQTSARTRTRMQICVRTHAHNHARTHTGCLQQLPLIDRYIEDGD